MKDDADGLETVFEGFGAFARTQGDLIESVVNSTANTASLPGAVMRMEEAEIEPTPYDVVYKENKLSLLHYEPLTEEQHDVPVLVVYALINKPYILDLQPNRSVVRRLLEGGFDVYLIDWGEPSRLDEALGVEDYVKRYIDNCVEEVRERSGTDVTILGYCMGGTMSAMYAALYPEKVRNLALMASGLYFDGEGGVLELWGDDAHFDPDKVSDAFGNAPADFLNAGFDLLEPVENTFSKYVRLFDNLDDPDFVDNFARMEKWLNDGPDVPGRAFAEFVGDIYQDNLLYRNELYLGDEHVDVNEIDMPLLQIVAKYDHLIPPSASKPFNGVVSSDDTEIFEHPAGHIGLSVSSSSHAELWPRVCDWLAERSDAEGGEEGAESGETEADAVESEEEANIEEIDGIGPTYAGRLREAGIESIDDLRDASLEEVAETAEVSEKRARDWLEQAQKR
ncbi:MAG: class III poly(R)-hydroxyalkanoic acid synthase subunit PhaC [Halobacteriales archaeon]|nr:class III poly(R)-hydroxyalkanoic acid synthase subunit PhaC [Halobacteriales archaeon]